MKLQFQLFLQHPEVAAFISERKDGSMKTDGVMETFFRKNLIPPDFVVKAKLVHGNRVVTVGEEDGGQEISETDALVTNARGLFLVITVADCLPLFLFDPKTSSIGLVHAGWKGLAKRIPEKAMQAMQKTYGSDPADVLCAIGPGIGKCHYDVKEDRALHFQDFPSALSRREGKTFLDLKSVAKQELILSGIQEENIEDIEECTACKPQTYFSFRRDKPEVLESMVVVFGLV